MGVFYQKPFKPIANRIPDPQAGLRRDKQLMLQFWQPEPTIMWQSEEPIMLFELKSPLLGFESLTSMELQKIDDIFMRLQAPGADEPSFTLINPFVLRDYNFEVPTPLQQIMGITDASNLLIFNIIVVQTPIENSLINFVAPLVFNVDTRTMAQVIISDHPAYGIAEPISKYLKGGQDA